MKKDSKSNIGKLIYFEWLIPLVDYFRILKKKEFTFDIVLPILISVGVVTTYQIYNLVGNAVSKMSSLLPNVLAILIGFTISAIAIIITSSDNKIQILSEKSAFDRKIDGKEISLYQFILVTLIYVLIQEIINLVLVFFVAFISPVINSLGFKSFALGLYVFYILHILAIIVRAIVQLYTHNYKK